MLVWSIPAKKLIIRSNITSKA